MRPTGADPHLRAGIRAAYAARMATPSIRRAVPLDLDALLALEDASFTSDRINRRQWRRHIIDNTTSILVAGALGDIDAAAVVFYRRGSRKARLYSLAVRARARGHGLGAALLAAAEADARTHACVTMQLEVGTANTSAIALYEGAGYARVAPLPRFYEDGTDAWRYTKALAAAD